MASALIRKEHDMIRPRLVTLAAVTVLALSTALVSTASAFPEFSPSTSDAYRSPHSVWTDGSGTTTCTSNTGVGEITGATSVGKVVLTYKGCTVINNKSEKCTVKSPGAAEGEIITHTLKGLLGEVALAEANSGVGLLLESESGGTISVTEKNACFVESSLGGSVIGELPSPHRSSKFSYIVFETSGSNQRITRLTLKSGSKAAELEDFGESVVAEGAGGLELTAHAVEIT
jgi:hypothetical protein